MQILFADVSKRQRGGRHFVTNLTLFGSAIHSLQKINKEMVFVKECWQIEICLQKEP